MLSTKVRTNQFGLGSSANIGVHLFNKVEVRVSEAVPCLSIQSGPTQVDLYVGSLEELECLAHLITCAVAERRGELALPPSPDELAALRQAYAVETPF